MRLFVFTREADGSPDRFRQLSQRYRARRVVEVDEARGCEQREVNVPELDGDLFAFVGTDESSCGRPPAGEDVCQLRDRALGVSSK